jgi:hypothetical protein
MLSHATEVLNLVKPLVETIDDTMNVYPTAFVVNLFSSLMSSKFNATAMSLTPKCSILHIPFLGTFSTGANLFCHVAK